MKKYMRVYACVSKAALIHNIKEIRNKVPKDILLMPVIKADAYGHSSKAVAEALNPYADYYAVAIIEEALSLRAIGITKPIILLGYTSPSYFCDAVKNNITVTVFTLDAAKKLSSEASKLGIDALVHIAIDTGMCRIGFPYTLDSVDIIKEISRLPNLKLEGIFTHFAVADEVDHSFTNLQAERFKALIEKLSEEGIDIPIKHCSNSAAVMEYPKYGFNLVRTGIIVYGLYPSNEVDKSHLSLIPAMELISNVVYVKSIHKGDTVSYGRTFTAEKEMKVATVPVGYADGYPRMLSGKGRVLVNGKYAKILGRICMDQFMIDVTDIENVKEGDKVTLIGVQGENKITADEVASLAQTINYEIVCGIGKRVPRVIEE